MIMKILAYTVNSCSFAIEFMLTFTISVKQHLRIKYVTITGGTEIITKVGHSDQASKCILQTADVKSAGYFFFL